MHIGNRGQKERWRCREDWKEGNCGGRGEVEGEKGYRGSGGRWVVGRGLAQYRREWSEKEWGSGKK